RRSKRVLSPLIANSRQFLARFCEQSLLFGILRVEFPLRLRQKMRQFVKLGECNELRRCGNTLSNFLVSNFFFRHPPYSPGFVSAPANRRPFSIPHPTK